MVSAIVLFWGSFRVAVESVREAIARSLNVVRYSHVHGHAPAQYKKSFFPFIFAFGQ